MGPRKHAPPADGDSLSHHAFAARQVPVHIPALRMAAKAWHPAQMIAWPLITDLGCQNSLVQCILCT